MKEELLMKLIHAVGATVGIYSIWTIRKNKGDENVEEKFNIKVFVSNFVLAFIGAIYIAPLVVKYFEIKDVNAILSAGFACAFLFPLAARLLWITAEELTEVLPKQLTTGINDFIKKRLFGKKDN